MQASSAANSCFVKCHWVVGTDVLKSYRKTMVNHSIENREHRQTSCHRNTPSYNSSAMLLNPGLKTCNILSWCDFMGRVTNHGIDSVRTHWVTNWLDGRLLFSGHVLSGIWSVYEHRSQQSCISEGLVTNASPFAVVYNQEVNREQGQIKFTARSAWYVEENQK